MPEYLAPGVFVEEVSFRAKSIEGVSTTTTGFVGATRYGPIDIEPEIVPDPRRRADGGVHARRVAARREDSDAITFLERHGPHETISRAVCQLPDFASRPTACSRRMRAMRASDFAFRWSKRLAARAFSASMRVVEVPRPALNSSRATR